VHAARWSRDWSWLVLAVSGGLVALALVAEFRRPLNPDVSWYLNCAERVLRGERLYTDILEINPPLIIWLSLPIAWLSRVLAIADAAIFRGAVLTMLVASCAAWVSLSSRAAGGMSTARRQVELAGIAFVLLPLVGGMFGQREHLLMALSLPLVALTAVRVAGGEIRGRTALATGIAAGLGFGLKPHYGAAWLLLVGYRWVAGDRPARRVLPEDVAVLGIGLAYPLLVVLLTPAYFTFISGFARDYMSYGSQTLLTILVSDSPALWFYVAVLGWLALVPRPRQAALCGALTVTGLGTVVAIAAQHKGWSYHYLPLSGCAVLLAVAALWPARATDPTESVPRLALRGVYAVLVGLFVAIIGQQTLHRATGPLDSREQRQVDMRAAIRGQTGAHTILVMSSQLRDGFPLVNESGLRTRAGYPSMWPPLVYYRTNKGPSRRVTYRAPDAMSPGERAAFDRIVQDVVEGRPDILVVESPALNERRMEFPGGFDFLRYFSQDPRAAAALAEYQRKATVDSLWVMRRVESRASNERLLP
jgi:hypothetical protein